MKKAIPSIGLLMVLAIPSGLLAQQAGYSQTNLVSKTVSMRTLSNVRQILRRGVERE